MADPILNSINTQSTNKQDKKTAADWVRLLRFNSEVNRSTLGVDTDRVTPLLLLGASSKLLKISRGLAEGDPKDSLQYQRFYGPVEYFAERIQKDGGSIARSLLWKATQKGNVDFIGTGVLQPHVNAVFNGSGISQYVDNSTPMDGVDNSMKVTRVGLGGVSSEDSVPIEMRLVQPSYMGYIDLVRTAEKSPGVTGYVTKNIMKGTDGKLYRNFYNPRTKQMELVDSQKAAASVVTTALYKDSTEPFVFAVGGSRGVRPIARDKVDYIMPYADLMFSLSANAVPMLSGVKGLRLLMGCLHPDTPVAFVDDNGYTDIVPAKRLGSSSKTYLMGCNSKGLDKLVPLRMVVPRFPDTKRKFCRVILESGRVLLTSPDHKWSIYLNGSFKLIKALLLKEGMIVPRSLFLSMPVRLSLILGTIITELICVLMGRILKSLEYSSKVYRFNYPKQLLSTLLKALNQLQVIDYAKYVANGINYISIKDLRFLDYLDQEVGLIASKRRVPKALLSLPEGFTALLLDAYTKTQDNVGLDSFGDIWLLDIPSAILRDGLSFMFNKIYTDTTYHDAMEDGLIKRALKLKPVEPTKRDIVLDPIRAIYLLNNPAMMIDLDCDDNVYACANGVITHNSKYTNQAIPLQQREASYVQSLDEATGKTMELIIGKKLGTVWAPKSGTVTAVRQDRIDMLYDDGTKGSVPLYNNYPANAKGFLHSYPKVKAGQKVSADQLLASSNYTDDNGVAALGRNLRVAYMSYKGGTYEDGCTISLSAAKKLGYTTMYKTDMDIDRTIRNSKSLYNTWKPGLFNKLQLLKLDDHGVVKPGTILKKGDPMILGIQTSLPSPGTMGKRLLTDVSKTWLHLHLGVVTDVARTKTGIRIFATVSSPFQLGDKLTGMHGSKGLVSRILPDDQMPRDEKGRPILILFDPLGIVSRCYDKLTLFLTRLGWKKGLLVKDTDWLLSFDPSTFSCYWSLQQLPLYKKLYYGMVFGVATENIDFKVTRNHSFYASIDGLFGKYYVLDIYGKDCSIPISSSNNLDCTIANIKATDWFSLLYKGMVYCPTVSTGFVVVRRNGKQMIAGNTNPAQLSQAALGKVALKLGHRIVVPQFMPKGQSRLQWTKLMMKKHNVPWKLTVTDPLTGRKISNVFVGVNYFLPLKHMALSKMSARGTLLYSALGIPGGKGMSGCFPAMQNIMTVHGLRSIATICLKRIPLYVYSWDKLRLLVVLRQVTDWFIYRAKVLDILNIFTLNTLSCGAQHTWIKHTNSSYPTKNHKMYMADGSIKLASLLKVGLYLAGLGCLYTEDQIQALYGTLLGDSCRTSDGRGIQCIHSGKQYLYINWKRSIFAAVGASRVSNLYIVKSDIKQRGGKTVHCLSTAVGLRIPYSYYVLKALENILDSKHKRHITKLALLKLGLFGFCLWFLDDGSLSNGSHNKGKFYPLARIATNSFSVLLVLFAAQWLLLNLLHTNDSTHITVYKGVYDQDQPVLNFRREASWLILRLIAKHIPYKVIPKSKIFLRKYCKLIQATTPCVQHNFNSPLGLVPVKIIDIKPYKHDKPGVTLVNVYDFTVDKTHNYCLTGGINVSNSKRLGGLESAGLIGHNAFDFLVTDAKLIRGQANSDFWRSIRTGTIPTIPGLPLVHKKFFAHLQGAGVNVRKTTKGISVFALSNKDVLLLAGHRELKTRDTYLQKNFRPIDGGLFGKDIFGLNGQQWGYIQLDEPLPNPVMQESLARILNIPLKIFKGIVTGSTLYNGMKNSNDIVAALKKIDIAKLTYKALQLLKTAKNSAKDNALKRYVALAQIRDSGNRPLDYMLDKIPVLPPELRPVSTHSGLTMVADSNYLYAQLLDARDDFRDAKDLPDLYLVEARKKLYNSWQLLVGLNDPLNAKLKSKNVGGLLKWAIGIGRSPKLSAFARKIYGSTVDTVGRGVVIPDSRLKLNQIGMPLLMMWHVYAPFATRKLVQAGYTPVAAMQQVKLKSPAARLYLMKAVLERPVVMNRAPSLHKLSLMGFNVVPVAGHAIKVNPSIVVPFGMDFDGDTVWNLVLIWFTREAENELFSRPQQNSLHFSNNSVYCVYKDKSKGLLSKVNIILENKDMFAKDTVVQLASCTCMLGDLPVVEGSMVQKNENTVEWDVKEGYYANTVDPVTGEIVMAPITKVSKHTNLKMFDCTMNVSRAYSHVVTASEDHSLITLDKKTLELVKTKPEDAVGALVPVVKKNAVNDHDNCFDTIKLDKVYPLSYNMGVFLGTIIGDGWVDSNNSVFVACADPSFQNYMVNTWKADTKLPVTKDVKLYSFKPSADRFSSDNMERISVYMDSADALELKKKIGAGAINKRIPHDVMIGSRTALIGVLCGLLATDGHVGISKTASKKAPIKNVAYHTISPTLRDNIQELCMRLGIRTRVTPYMGANSKSTCYAIGFCLEDVAALKREYPTKFVIPVDYKEEALKEICADIDSGVKNSFDLVPYPRGLFCEFSYVGAGKMFKGTIPEASKKGYIKREYAKKLADKMEKADWENYVEPPYLKFEDRTGHTPEEAKALVQKWIDIVRNEDITWEVVESVTPATVTEGWDCTVPGPYTFTLSTGTVVQDTVNLHVPVSQKAIRDVRLKMMPLRNLISMRDHKILYKPLKAFMQGLYVATRMGLTSDVKTFNNTSEAKLAYRKGLIDIDTPIVIKQG